MGTALIVGKGPTARRVANGFLPIAALNGACKLCGRIDWLFVNDTSALREIAERDLNRATEIVTPRYLHVTTDARTLCRAEDVPELAGRPNWRCYRLQTDPEGGADFGTIHSVGETTVCWLLRLGFRNFLTIGIDPVGGYSEHFSDGPQEKKPKDWFLRNWERMQRRVADAGGTVRRI